MRIGYRWGQFWRTLRAKPLPEEAQAEITAVLTPTEAVLFGRFSLSEQQHSYGVLRTLRDAGHTQPELLTAALLHDIGKTRAPLSVWERSLIVLAQKWVPGKTAVWGQGQAQGWRRPFVVKAQHPAWGAEMVRQASSSPLVVTLIRRHQDAVLATAVTKEDKLLRLLQWADDQN